jgi:hypothetical protein
MQELAYFNEPLDIPNGINWKIESRPHFVFLPYSQTMIKWNENQHKWDYEDHSENSLSPCSYLSSSSSFASSNSSISLQDPIDQFEQEDREMEFTRACV